jgi:hypothetical protein
MVRALDLAGQALDAAMIAPAPPAGALFDWPRLSAELNADLRRMVDSGAAAMDQPTALADITPELILDAAPLFASPLDFTTAGPMFSAITDEFGTFLETDAAVFQATIGALFSPDPFSDTAPAFIWAAEDRWNAFNGDPIIDPARRFETIYSCSTAQ